MINCAEYFLCKLPTKVQPFITSGKSGFLSFTPFIQMMTCCKRSDKSKLLDEDSGDEGNFIKQSDIKQKTLLDPKAGVSSDAITAIKN